MPHKLLLADDSVTIQRVIELTFADEDIDVIAVGDGREAISRIESDPPDIVLADIGMPEKDGYEVAAFVKRSPKYSHIPVLLLTGAFEPIDEQRAQDVGCDGVLAKPFEPQMVITRVNELLAAAPPRLTTGSRTPMDLPPPQASFARAPEQSFELPPMREAEPAFDLPPMREPIPSFEPPPMPLAAPRPAGPAIDFALPPPPAAPAVPPAPVEPPLASGAPLSALDAFLSAAPDFDLAAYGLGPESPSQGAAASPGPPAPPPPAPEPVSGLAAEPAVPAMPLAPPTLELPEFESGRAAPVPDPEPAEAREMLEPPSVRISRRTPIAIPGFGAPALPKPGTQQAELDDYFEKLDAAFASLNQSAPPPTVRPAAVVPPLEPSDAPFAPPTPAPSQVSPFGRAPLPAEPAAPAFEPSAGIAQAFSALLAAEHGQAFPAPPVTPAPASALTPEVIDDLVERVAQRVLERMTDRTVRDAVTDIVSRVAERLVREEIDRVKSTIK